jgi:nicotinamide mononucleotide transporter PnuC
VGATSLIFNAKGNPIGQFLAVVFSIVYAVISYSYAYYGEMITYLGMTAPMAVIALISWLRNPYNGNKVEVKVNTLSKREIAFMCILAVIVTVVFNYILKAFNTANIVPSTLSITTSFLAVYMTFRRSPYYAIAYCANDIILIVMWVLATITDTSYVSVVVCFIMFLANDIYGFINWKRMQKRQLS